MTSQHIRRTFTWVGLLLAGTLMQSRPPAAYGQDAVGHRQFETAPKDVRLAVEPAHAPTVLSDTSTMQLVPPHVTLLAQNSRRQPEVGLLPPPSGDRSLPADPSVSETQLSEAERITSLKKSLEADQKTLSEIEASLNDPDSEYVKAEAAFKQLDAQLEDAKQQLADCETDDDETLRDAVEKTQAEWKLAKDRFELAIQERKTVKEKVATLQEQLRQNQAALNALTGTAPPTAPLTAPLSAPPVAPSIAPPTAPLTTPPTTPATTSAALSPTETVSPTPTSTAPTVVAAPVHSPVTAQPAAPAAPPAIASPPPVSSSQMAVTPLPAPSPAPAAAAAAPAPSPEKPESKELIAAAEDAQAKETAAVVAEQQAQSVADRMELLRKDVELERQLLASARKKADIAEQTRSAVDEEYATGLREGAPGASLQELRAKAADARQRFLAASAEARDSARRLDDLQSRYVNLQSEKITALQQAEQKRLAAESARKKVEQLRNPFTAQNMLQWLIDHGPRVAALLLAMVLAVWVSRIAEHRIVDAIVHRGGEGLRTERENRARTLVSVFHNAANVAIIGGGALMILDTIGAPITALMGGAAVFGLAIAFGAQNLIKDYFYGFMILLEQQYTINDVIRIGDISGMVERITLRMTVLRDLEGRVHFIPHGQISSTTNMTYGWSRAVFDVGVAYKENVDSVIGVIEELGHAMRQDSEFGPLILEDLTMLGVDGFGDSAVVIKFFIKTLPLQQWAVKRELMRRIKRRFDQLGIEIPFPHRTVYHHHVEENGANLALGADPPQRKSA